MILFIYLCIYICICPKSNSHQPPFLTVMACAKVGRRGTSIDLCLDEVAFDLTRPSAFGHRGCNMWQCVLKYIHGKGKNGVTRWLLAVLPIVLSQSFLSTFSQTKTKCLLHILSRWMACICQTWGWCWMRSSGASLAAQCLWRQIAAVCPVCPFAGNGCCRWFTIYISQPVGMLMA